MSIILDEAPAYENRRDYDCCKIIEKTTRSATQSTTPTAMEEKRP